MPLVLGWGIASPAQPAEHHASPEGTPQGDGSATAPWDLATALAASDRVQPGDTVWLAAGTYRGGFESSLRGTPEKPVTVRAVPGARVTLDLNPSDPKATPSLTLRGADAIYRGFAVTCSHPKRETAVSGSWPEDIRRGSVEVRGDRLALIHLVVHDLGSGFGFWSEGEGGEISGCVIYHNGWRGPDRGHGHGIYAQNERGTKRIRDNAIFHQFGHGIQAYGSEKASLKGFEIEGNVIFDNGVLHKAEHRSTGLLVGGATPAERIVVRNNIVAGGEIRLGYQWGTMSEDVLCEGNHSEGLVVRDFRRGRVAGNTVVAHSQAARWQAADSLQRGGLEWNDNAYHVTDGRWGDASVEEKGKTRGFTFAEWQEATGFDSRSTFRKGPVSAESFPPRVVVRPSPHEPGRALVAVVNPAGLPEVDLDLSATGLASGGKFRLVSVKDVFGPPLLRGTHQPGKTIRLPLEAREGPPPVGMTREQAPVPTSEPAFAAFLVLPE